MFIVLLLTAGDAEMVLRPILWMTAALIGVLLFFSALFYGIYLFARWLWVELPQGGYHVHHLSLREIETLEQASREAENQEEQFHYEAVLLSAQGYSVREIARATDHEKSDVDKWLRLFDKFGPAILH
jgi:hypothetical protein